MQKLPTIPELLEKRARQTPHETAYWWKDDAGNWNAIDWVHFYQTSYRLKVGLLKHGLVRGRAVGIMAHTSLQWELSHMAVLAAGGVVVGLDPHEVPDNLAHAIVTADISILVVASRELLEVLPEKARNQVRLVVEIESSNSREPEPAVLSFDELCNTEVEVVDVDYTDPSQEDLATIIFTSGTTGTPKAIAYRHEQVVFACSSILDTYNDISQGSRLACWLPLSNLFQRMVNLCAIQRGAQTFFVTDPRRIMDELPKISPHVFIAVPRFYEKLYEGLESELAKKPAFIQSLILFCLKNAEADGSSSIGAGGLSALLRDTFRNVNRLLLKKFTDLFGENLRYLISGSAPMPLWLLKRMEAMGLLVLEAYGISENIVPISANRPTEYRFGTVGKPLPGNSVKLSDDGELLISGEGVFHGYLNKDRRSAEPEEDQRYFPTGDYAQIGEDGFLRLTGRKSEVFKTSTGRKIAPFEIEAAIKQVSGVDQAVVFGSGKKVLTAILSVTPPKVSEEGELKSGISQPEFSTLRAAIKESLADFPSFKRPAALVITTRPFTIVDGELTSNLKIRRNTIQQNYGRYLDRLYEELENGEASSAKQAIFEDEAVTLVWL
ncbi:MAG: AMP-binding protein [Sedimenticola sp.]